MLFYDSIVPGVLLFPAVLWEYRKRRKKQVYRERLRNLRKDLLELVTMLTSFLLAGYSAEQGMERVHQELVKMRGWETDLSGMLASMLREIRLGENAQTVWMNVSRETQVEELRDLGQIFALSGRSGASLPGILKRTSSQLIQKLQTEEQISVQAAGKQMEQRIMNWMPAGILAYVRLTSGDMMQVMYTTAVGRIIMTVCLAIYVGAFCLAEKMMGELERV